MRAYLISVTFPFVRIAKKTSETSSVSVRPLCGKRPAREGHKKKVRQQRLCDDLASSGV